MVLRLDSTALQSTRTCHGIERWARRRCGQHKCRGVGHLPHVRQGLMRPISSSHASHSALLLPRWLLSWIRAGCDTPRSVFLMLRCVVPGTNLSVSKRSIAVTTDLLGMYCISTHAHYRRVLLLIAFAALCTTTMLLMFQVSFTAVIICSSTVTLAR